MKIKHTLKIKQIVMILLFMREGFWLGNVLPTNLTIPSDRIKKASKENRADLQEGRQQ